MRGNMIKKYEVENIIKNALLELDGMFSEPVYRNNEDVPTQTVYEATVEEDSNGDLIFTFKEDCLSKSYDRYKIKIEYDDTKAEF